MKNANDQNFFNFVGGSLDKGQYGIDFILNTHIKNVLE